VKNPSDVVEMVRAIVHCLVDDEGSVDLRVVASDANSIIELRLAKADYGKVIGREGAHVFALRTLLNAAAKKYARQFTLSIIDTPPAGAQNRGFKPT
jgi:predicted RNA-binding protein YlqC (UPF0109 family)